jgi:DNA mismatch repair ATPase MutS
MSAVLGQGLQGADYALRKPNGPRKGLLQRLTGSRSPSYSFSLDPRDEGGASILADLRDRGANVAANAVAQAADHIDDFFDMLRLELAFYVGCLNLSERLAELAEPIVFPVPAPTRERRHTFTGLYDVCLALTMKQRVVGNKVQADDKVVAIITGANQGGKSVFLRSVGLAQLMMQCGMFVPAESFSATACSGLFTHYKREEDKTLTSGKLDEELGRMSEIVDHIAPDGLVLFNESFAATNEREGSEIARQVVSALLEKRIKVVFVTHQYEFAHGMLEQHASDAIFLRAERLPDGTRTFKLIEGDPLQTSYGKDLYDDVFVGGGRDGAAPGERMHLS